MVMGPKAQLQKVGDFLLQVDDCSISPFHEVRNLGVILDSTLSYQSHIKTVTKSAFFRPSLSDSVVETLIHALISLRLNYCAVSCSGSPTKPATDYSIFKIQLPEGSPAPDTGSTSPRLSNVSNDFRLSSASHTNWVLAPQYLPDLLKDHSPSRNLRFRLIWGYSPSLPEISRLLEIEHSGAIYTNRSFSETAQIFIRFSLPFTRSQRFHCNRTNRNRTFWKTLLRVDFFENPACPDLWKH